MRCIKNGSNTKKPIVGGSNGLPALKNEKKKVIKRRLRVIDIPGNTLHNRKTTCIRKINILEALEFRSIIVLTKTDYADNHL